MWYCWGAGLQPLKLPQLQGHIFQCAHARTHAPSARDWEDNLFTHDSFWIFSFASIRGLTLSPEHEAHMRQHYTQVTFLSFFLSIFLIFGKPWEQKESCTTSHFFPSLGLVCVFEGRERRGGRIGKLHWENIRPWWGQPSRSLFVRAGAAAVSRPLVEDTRKDEPELSWPTHWAQEEMCWCWTSLSLCQSL